MVEKLIVFCELGVEPLRGSPAEHVGKVPAGKYPEIMGRRRGEKRCCLGGEQPFLIIQQLPLGHHSYTVLIHSKVIHVEIPTQNLCVETLSAWEK